MKRIPHSARTAIPVLLTIAILMMQAPSIRAQQDSPTSRSASEVGFIENRGQVDESVRYYVLGRDLALYFTPDALVLDVKQPTPAARFRGSAGSGWTAGAAKRDGTHGWVLRIRFSGASPEAWIEGREILPCRYNYLRGVDPLDWHTDVPAYAEVVYHDLWLGTDVVFWEEAGALRYRFESRTGAQPGSLLCEGATQIDEDPNGALLCQTEVGTLSIVIPGPSAADGRMTWHPPQGPGLDEGQDQPDGQRDDPTSLIWSTFLGGSGFDGESVSAGLTSTQSPIVAGYTESSNFPVTTGAYDTSMDGSTDITVAKLDPTGSSLLWCTYLGGSGDEFNDGNGLAVDSNNRPVLMGRTYSSDFPTTASAYDQTFAWGNYFVSKLTTTGNGLVWSTFLGDGGGFGFAIALDTSNNPVMTGQALSGFPTTPGAYDQTFNGGYRDAFVAKLSANGSALLWSTFLGGSDDDQGWALQLDASGNPVAVGATASTNFPVSAGAYDLSYNGGSGDLFVSKLSANGSALLWSTFLGGSDDDWSLDMDLDAAGNPVLTGQTLSANYPLTASAVDPVFGGSTEGFVSKLSANGSTLQWSTFLGGSGSDIGYGVRLDSSDNPSVVGVTYSSDFPTTSGGYDTSYNGGADGFVARLDPLGTQTIWSSYLGTGGIDIVDAISIAPNDEPVIAGATSSSSFPTTPGAYDRSYNGGMGDQFVARLAVPNPTASTPSLDPSEGDLSRAALRIWPNPVREETSVFYSLERPGSVALELFDVTGQRVRHRVSERQGAGGHQLALNLGRDSDRDLPGGVYFLKLHSEGDTKIAQLILLR